MDKGFFQDTMKYFLPNLTVQEKINICVDSLGNANTEVDGLEVTDALRVDLCSGHANLASTEGIRGFPQFLKEMPG